MEAVTIRRPSWVLTWSGRDVSRDIQPMVLNISYTDALHGEAEDLAITVENADGRWFRDWQPAKGDALALRFGYEGGALQPTNGFQIDELEYNFAPDTLAIKAVAAGVKPALRTSRTTGYDGSTLRAIAAEVAARHNLTLVGAIDELPLGRVTQNGERDLAFLKRLAEQHGYVCTVRGEDLIFHKVADLKSRPAGVVIRRSMVMPGGSIKIQNAGTYGKAKLTYHDPDTKQTIEAEADDDEVENGDTLRLSNERVENHEQAETRVKAALEKANRGQREGRLILPGEPTLAAGVMIDLKGFGSFDGGYLVEKATHRIDRGGGYTTEINFKDGV